MCVTNCSHSFPGEWSPKQIDNPDFQGMWVHPEIPNPEYVADDNLYRYEDFGVIGIDIWQVCGMEEEL